MERAVEENLSSVPVAPANERHQAGGYEHLRHPGTLWLLSALGSNFLKSAGTAVFTLSLLIVFFCWSTILLYLFLLRLDLSTGLAATITTVAVLAVTAIPIYFIRKQVAQSTELLTELKETPVVEFTLFPKVSVEKIKSAMPKVALCALGAGIFLGLTKRNQDL